MAVACAAACGVPVVLTPLMGERWQHTDDWRARLARRLLGPGAGRSSCGQLRQAVCQATLVLARSSAERAALAAMFPLAPDRLRLLPPALADGWFEADAALFRQRTGMRGEFALMAGPIDARHEQLELAHALREMALPLVVAGTPHTADGAYLQRLREVPGVRVLGELAQALSQPRLRASVAAAASMFIVAGSGAAGHGVGADADADADAIGEEVNALTALAAGTAVVIAPARARDLPDSDYAVKRLHWRDRRRRAVLLGLLEAPPLRERVRALVAGHRWEAMAARLSHCYVDAIALHGPAANPFVGAAGGRQLLDRAAR